MLHLPPPDFHYGEAFPWSGTIHPSPVVALAGLYRPRRVLCFYDLIAKQNRHIAGLGWGMTQG